MGSHLSPWQIAHRAIARNFPGETPDGAVILAAKVRSALNQRFKSCNAPREVFTDRGKGFYNAGNGQITREYAAALRTNDLSPFMGRDAAIQPGNLQELYLHETAVSWIKRRLAWTKPVCPWEESREEYGQRLKGIARDINKELDVDGLCSSFMKRIDKLVDSKGRRLHY